VEMGAAAGRAPPAVPIAARAPGRSGLHADCGVVASLPDGEPSVARGISAPPDAARNGKVARRSGDAQCAGCDLLPAVIERVGGWAPARCGVVESARRRQSLRRRNGPRRGRTLDLPAYCAAAVTWQCSLVPVLCPATGVSALCSAPRMRPRPARQAPAGWRTLQLSRCPSEPRSGAQVPSDSPAVRRSNPFARLGTHSLRPPQQRSTAAYYWRGTLTQAPTCFTMSIRSQSRVQRARFQLKHTRTSTRSNTQRRLGRRAAKRRRAHTRTHAHTHKRTHEHAQTSARHARRANKHSLARSVSARPRPWPPGAVLSPQKSQPALPADESRV
jgi:hypothetical protein